MVIQLVSKERGESLVECPPSSTSFVAARHTNDISSNTHSKEDSVQLPAAFADSWRKGHPLRGPKSSRLPLIPAAGQYIKALRTSGWKFNSIQCPPPTCPRIVLSF